VAAGANTFARSLGSAVGAAIFGAIANATLADRVVGLVAVLLVPRRTKELTF